MPTPVGRAVIVRACTYRDAGVHNGVFSVPFAVLVLPDPKAVLDLKADKDPQASKDPGDLKADNDPKATLDLKDPPGPALVSDDTCADGLRIFSFVS
jgi:hypothetical protein